MFTLACHASFLLLYHGHVCQVLFTHNVAIHCTLNRQTTVAKSDVSVRSLFFYLKCPTLRQIQTRHADVMCAYVCFNLIYPTKNNGLKGKQLHEQYFTIMLRQVVVGQTPPNKISIKYLSLNCQKSGEWPLLVNYSDCVLTKVSVSQGEYYSRWFDTNASQEEGVSIAAY